MQNENLLMKQQMKQGLNFNKGYSAEAKHTVEPILEGIGGLVVKNLKIKSFVWLNFVTLNIYISIYCSELN